MSDVHWDGGQGEVVLARDTTGGVLLSTGVTICGILWPPTWSINNWFMIRGCKSKVWSWQSKEWGSWFPSQCPYWVYLCRDCTQISGWLVLWMFQYFHCVTVSVGILIRKQETHGLVYYRQHTDCLWQYNVCPGVLVSTEKPLSFWWISILRDWLMENCSTLW